VKNGPGRQSNHSVVVGHSFGGLILEYAIQSQMEQIGRELHEELAKAPSSGPLQLPALANFADLVVLINQAAPADHAVTLLSQFRNEVEKVRLRWPASRPGCTQDDLSPDCGRSHPLLLSISSTSDLATKTILPIAETISPPKDRPRVLSPGTVLPDGLDVKKVFTTAAAHTPQLHSHNLIPCNKPEDCAPCDRNDNADDIPISVMLPAYAPGNDTRGDKPLRYCLLPDSNAWNRTPYWIFQIPPQVVPDHGTIFTNRFRDFLTAFMPPPEVFMQPTPPQMQQLYRAAGR
jgi:hypothetical protein